MIQEFCIKSLLKSKGKNHTFSNMQELMHNATTGMMKSGQLTDDLRKQGKIFGNKY